jgi:molecular chaperone Hsp33
VPIVTGEVADDLANYLVDSEQTNTALGLGVSLDRDAQVKSAGGFLISVGFCSG